MAYTDVNTPVISGIQLPSGNKYYIADRELRDVVDVLSDTVAGGVSYNLAWDGTSAPTVANIPEGITVTYNGTDYTGTLSANSATPGAFYLVPAGGSENNNIYAEYVPVGLAGSKTWEKIGDTAVDLSDYVTAVTINKQTDTVIGTDATFTITQPTIALTTGAVAGTGVISVATGITSATASGDEVTVVTGYANPTKENAVKSVSPTTAKLATTTVTGVSGSTTASKATATTSQTTADGNGTSSQTNTDWLKGVSVSNGVLTIGAATMDTQTTTQFTFADVTVPTAASSATTVATGSTTSSGSGASIVTDVSVGDTISAITALGTASTDTVLGAGSTITVTPTTTNIKATASGANTAWNNKDSVTVLTNSTDVNVTKGS